MSIRDALSQLQMAYTQMAGQPAPGPEGAESGEQPPSAGGTGPAQSSGRLWVPGQ